MSGSQALAIGIAPKASLKVNQSKALLNEIHKWYLDKECSDIQFVVETKKYPAHKIVMTKRSPFFKRMFEEHQDETEIELKNTGTESFLLVLFYLYTGQFKLETWTVAHLKEILDLVDLYNLTKLHDDIFEALVQCVCLSNVCDVLQIACHYNHDHLKERCLKIIDREGQKVFETPGFERVPLGTLEQIISRESMKIVDEIVKFRAIARWAKKHPDQEPTPAMKHVNFPKVSTVHLVSEVQVSKLLPEYELLRLITSSVMEQQMGGSREKRLSTVQAANIAESLLNEYQASELSFQEDDISQQDFGDGRHDRADTISNISNLPDPDYSVGVPADVQDGVMVAVETYNSHSAALPAQMYAQPPHIEVVSYPADDALPEAEGHHSPVADVGTQHPVEINGKASKSKGKKSKK